MEQYISLVINPHIYTHTHTHTHLFERCWLLYSVERSLWKMKNASFLVVIVAICALDIVSDKVPASDNLADHEEDIGFSSDETGVEVLGL